MSFIYYSPHRIPVCSLEMPLTRRVSWGCSFSRHVGKTTDDYADSLVLSLFSWPCSRFMRWQMLSTKMDSHSKDQWKASDFSRWKDTRTNLTGFSGIDCLIFLVSEKVTKLILSFSKQALACGVYFSDICFKYCPFWNTEITTPIFLN